MPGSKKERAQSAPPGPSRAMTGRGASTSNVGAKKNHIQIAGSFLASIKITNPDLGERWGESFMAVPEAELIQQEFWGHLATYLTMTYVIPEGNKNQNQHVGVKTAHGYWGSLLDLARERFKQSHDSLTRAFFDDIQQKPGSTVARWYGNMKRNMEREIVQRKIAAGESLDESATQLFHDHVKEICAAYARADTAEAASRKLAVKTLWRAAGRAGEPAEMTYNGMAWNALFQTAQIQSPMPKPSRVKYVVFVAGTDRHADWLLDFGDNLIFQARTQDSMNMVFPPGTTPWLLPELQTVANASSKLASYIKDVQKGTDGLERYQEWGITSLPPNPTAAGIRPGAADTLAISVPAELAVHNTGHDMTSLSAFFEYLRARIALLIPGANVLAGWPAHLYGQLGPGPKHPTLTAILGVGIRGVAVLHRRSRRNRRRRRAHSGSAPWVVRMLIYC